MSARAQLRQLLAERDAELRHANRLYSGLKFRVRRAPDRMVRRHLGLSLLTAATLGLILAPAPRYHRPERPRRVFPLLRLIARIARHIPELQPILHPFADTAPQEVAPESSAATTPTPAAPASSQPSPPPPPPLAVMLGQVIAVLTTQLDWPRIIAALLDSLRPPSSPASAPPTDPATSPAADPAAAPASQTKKEV